MSYFDGVTGPTTWVRSQRPRGRGWECGTIPTIALLLRVRPKNGWIMLDLSLIFFLNLSHATPEASGPMHCFRCVGHWTVCSLASPWSTSDSENSQPGTAAALCRQAAEALERSEGLVLVLDLPGVPSRWWLRNSGQLAGKRTIGKSWEIWE